MLVLSLSEILWEMGMAMSCDIGPDTTWQNVLDTSLLDYVPKHWLSFKPPSKAEHFIAGSLYVILMSTGFAANGTIIILFSR